MRLKGEYNTKTELNEFIQVSSGKKPCDVVFKNAHFLDVFSGRFIKGDVALYKNKIVGVMDSYEGKEEIDASGSYIVPGFIDSHVHIESTLVTPARFQETILPCGTTTVFWDPHEIANVAGEKGLEWAFKASDGLDLDVFVMLSSCVPATSKELEFETSGAELLVGSLEKFKDHERTLGLAEMMNFPGLLMGSDEVLDKIQSFKGYKKDGHCPGLLGKDLNAYGVAGIHSCHESTRLDEAKEKLTKGIHVLIREGSCAKDADELLPLIDDYSSSVVALCTDDRNPLDIKEEGHLDFILNKALASGHRPENVFRAASFAAAKAYGLDDRGAVAPGYLADLVVISKKGSDWNAGFRVDQVFKSGSLVKKEALEKFSESSNVGLEHKNMNISERLSTLEAFLDAIAIKVSDPQKKTVKCRVIGAVEGSIVSEKKEATLQVLNGEAKVEGHSEDILKMVVVERHHSKGYVGVGLVSGFGLQSGAIATSINHDCHNIIIVGATDDAIEKAYRKLVEIDGGIVVYDGDTSFEALPLPIGGLMTGETPQFVAESLKGLKGLAKKIGCPLVEPFLTLSFLALPVIPTYKLTDRGLIDVTTFSKVEVVMG